MTGTGPDSNDLMLRVVGRQDDRGNVVRLQLAHPDGDVLPAFTAGAHIDVAAPAGGGALWRQYSLCGDPSRRDLYEIGVLKDPNSRGGSQAIHDHVHAGSLIRVSAPRNHFPLAASATRHVFLGAGIGVTPFLAMADAVVRDGGDFLLHYCTRSAAMTPFLDRVGTFSERVRFHHSTEGSRLTAADLPAPADGLHLYLCGPERFIESLESAARIQGHPEDRLHREYFAAVADTRGEGFVVEARASGITVEVQADESISNALLRSGIKVDVKCEEGVCGTCITDVIAGTPEHRDHFLTEEEKASNTAIALCCSRARGRLVLDI